MKKTTTSGGNETLSAIVREMRNAYQLRRSNETANNSEHNAFTKAKTETIIELKEIKSKQEEERIIYCDELWASWTIVKSRYNSNNNSKKRQQVAN